MSSLFPVNMFWWGMALGQIEIAAILSVLKCGHQLTLFGYERPNNLPDGVIWEDASQILPRERFVFFRNTNPSLGSDLFRYQLMAKSRGLWLDTDVLLLKPILQVNEDVYGWQDAGQINGAVLYISPNSKLLTDILNSVADEHPVPPFYSSKVQETLIAKKQAGEPVPVSQFPWGVWGPNALTYFCKLNGTTHLAKARQVFYPIHWTEAHKVFCAFQDIESDLTPETVAIHLWNAALRKPGKFRPDNPVGKLVIDRRSYFQLFCRREFGLRVRSET